MIKCPNPSCGKENPDGSLFCEDCGASLAEEEIAPQPQPVSPIVPPAPAEVAPQPQPEQPVAPPAPAEEIKCPKCGVSNPADSKFCSECGAKLREAPVSEPTVPTPTPTPPPTPTPKPSVATLVTATGQEIALPDKAEIIIGRTDVGIVVDIDTTPFGGHPGGVSRRHCKITVQGDQYSIDDLNSTNGTFVDGTQLAANTPTPLQNGAQIVLGKVVFTFLVS
ncbi:FHA domain-containing protein [Candidatus Poribacteria bacterium]|nr:FHA domain-containing protein [Candidatus Poribacteria bacterium]